MSNQAMAERRARIIEGVARRFALNHKEAAHGIHCEKRYSIYGLSSHEALGRFFRRWDDTFGEPHILEEHHAALLKYCLGDETDEATNAENISEMV